MEDHYECSQFMLHLEQVTIVSSNPLAPHISQTPACKE